ncbi:glucose-6-phosphate dehydrogenase [Acidiphilium iwatense]|uniref:Glucose-6-phosphate 1-dehydrogenase n=1 Tax=Acidiphilium iwatense TaxID=768198 RepID=A0ABS9DVW6_9PROT|nr:glucose-6-phosphate dehydrogenase [Acidiphilium iwatense]MCF3945821.1 glucose-6-phosphate dehydrogenase [Acidiphilium iwatense]
MTAMANHPLRDDATTQQPSSTKPPGPCSVVIFGAGGDLTKRLLVPALYNLAHTGLIPEKFVLIGADIAKRSADDWKNSLHKTLESFIGDPNAEDQIKKIDENTWSKFAGHLSYVQGDFTDAAFYQALKQELESLESQHGTGGNRLFYLAVADRFFGTIVEHLGEAGLVHEKDDAAIDAPWCRVVIEKPFGHSYASAQALNTQILGILKERQIYRIDHFLGKETVQNIMALRFGNGMFEPIWNRDRIDHVQITVAETVGVEGRGKFYEQTGALRDMVPNHVFQLLAMVTIEPPIGFKPEAIRDKKYELFAAIETLTETDAVRGQYGPGTVAGKQVIGYRDEPDVAKDSAIETYVAMRLKINNWRWAGVPFYIRTGKHMPQRMSEIAIRFKKAPLAAFQGTSLDTMPPNWLVLRIQPDEGISLQFEVKRPGQAMRLAPVKMDFRYRDWFAPEPNVGYETLLYDCMIGDQTLFQRADMVEETWRVVQQVLDRWAATKPSDFPNYASGSPGPDAADRLLSDDDAGRRWRDVALPKTGGRS